MAVKAAKVPEWHPRHFYFEKIEVLDGESEYPLLSVRATEQPLTKERWVRELLEFFWSTNGETPWSPEQIQKFLNTAHASLEVYGGTRIYRNFWLEEIRRDEYDVLERFLRYR
jgi:lipase chaperone LimK